MTQKQVTYYGILLVVVSLIALSLYTYKNTLKKPIHENGTTFPIATTTTQTYYPSSINPPQLPGMAVSPENRPSTLDATTIGGGLYFRVLTDQSIELIDYNNAATSTVVIPGARTLHVLPADYMQGISIILATETTLYQVILWQSYSSLIPAHIEKIADTDTRGAHMINDNVIVTRGGAYTRES